MNLKVQQNPTRRKWAKRRRKPADRSMSPLQRAHMTDDYTALLIFMARADFRHCIEDDTHDPNA